MLHFQFFLNKTKEFTSLLSFQFGNQNQNQHHKLNLNIPMEFDQTFPHLFHVFVFGNSVLYKANVLKKTINNTLVKWKLKCSKQKWV